MCKKLINVFEYVVDKHNNIWKYIKSKDHFIKVTPWQKGEDRRINRFEIENLIKSGKLTQMKGKPQIYAIINEKWDNDERTWEHDGMLFAVGKNFKENQAFDAPLHKFVHSYKTQDGATHEYTNDYRIGYFNGNLVWWTCLHYYPRTYIWGFEDLDKEPTGFGSWTNIKHIKPIYNLSLGNYI